MSVAEKSTILIVEDEFLVRMAAVDLVEEAGFLALEAGNADEAIAILEERPEVRLVLTDIDMPGTMDGLKLAHYVRSRWPPIHLIIASGKAMVEEADLPSGTRFLAKPYQGTVMSEALLAMLGPT